MTQANTEETMTATRALNELKLLNKRISKKIEGACFVARSVNGELKEKGCDAKADFQSVTDLISRREAIKAALMLSNSTTVVKILDEEMTVAVAIEKKSSIDYLETLLETMRERYYAITKRVERENEMSQDRLDRLLESTFGKDLKARPSEITDMSETFWKANKVEIYDTISIAQKIKELDEYIDNFKNEVDLILSEINAYTKIII